MIFSDLPPGWIHGCSICMLGKKGDGSKPGVCENCEKYKFNKEETQLMSMICQTWNPMGFEYIIPLIRSPKMLYRLTEIKQNFEENKRPL